MSKDYLLKHPPPPLPSFDWIGVVVLAMALLFLKRLVCSVYSAFETSTKSEVNSTAAAAAAASCFSPHSFV